MVGKHRGRLRGHDIRIRVNQLKEKSNPFFEWNDYMIRVQR
jgi:hypothetical protein